MIKTKIIKISSEHSAAIQDAVEILRAGGLVAFPTETVYGLGADALNEKAVKEVFTAKGRPSDNPLIVHIASLENAWQFTSEISEKGLRLAKSFWPGPLTLVTRRKAYIPDIITAGLDTVALRVPNHPVTLELLKQFGGGIVGPSANISGQPSPTSAEHVFNDLNGKIDLIIDAGSTTIGVESTVLDVTVEPPVILRVGGLSQIDIEKEIGNVRNTNADELLKRSPGTRHRHYAPYAKVILFSQENVEEFTRFFEQCKSQKKKVGVITHSHKMAVIENFPTHIAYEPSVEYFAHNIFRSLRELDRQEVDIILVESIEEEGLGAAVMDRLRKASS